MNRFLASILILGATMLYFIQNTHAHIEDNQDLRTVSISGEASVKASPDMADISFSIETEDYDFKKAREKNEEISAKVLNALRAMKFNEKNIVFKNLRVNEYREYEPKERKSIFKGYKAVRDFQVNIFIKDLKEGESLSDKVAQVVNASSQSGITRLQNVNYNIENTKELEYKALDQAIKNAQEKANILVTGLEARLGKVKTINENSYSQPIYYNKTYARSAMAMDVESSPIANPEAYSEGEMTVTSKVNVVFYIE